MAEIWARKSFLSPVLDRVERWGNRLPHPFNLFLLFALVVLLVSWLAYALGVSVTRPLRAAMVHYSCACFCRRQCQPDGRRGICNPRSSWSRSLRPNRASPDRWIGGSFR